MFLIKLEWTDIRKLGFLDFFIYYLLIKTPAVSKIIPNIQIKWIQF